MRTIVLIDGPNLWIRSHYSHLGLANSQKVPTGAEFGFLSTLLRLHKSMVAPVEIVICWEAGTLRYFPDTACTELTQVEVTNPLVCWRREVSKEYKSNRKPNLELLEVLNRLSSFIPFLLDPCPYVCLAMPKLEADDLISLLAANLAKQEDVARVCILSSDADLFQCLHPKVLNLSYGKGAWKFRQGKDLLPAGVSPDDWPKVRALSGDASDGLPGLPGVGLKTAVQMVAAGVHPGQPFNMLSRSLQQKYSKYVDNWEAVRAYYRLMRLPRKVCECPEVVQPAVQETLQYVAALKTQWIHKTALDSRIRRFTVYLADNEMTSLLAERRHFFSGYRVA